MKRILFLFTLFLALYCFSNGENKEVNWENVLKDFEEIALKGMKEEKIPGMAIGIVLGEQVPYLKGFGVKKEGSNDKVEPETVFQLASVAKPLTATVVAAAVTRGIVSWDAKIKSYIPTFAMKDDWVTREFMIKDALSHRSGLKPYAGDDLESLGYSLNEIIDRLKYIEPKTSFRSQYAYQNVIITLAGLATANAAKKDFNLLAKEVLFEPLDMKNSGYFFKDYQNASNKAYSHVKDEKGNWAPLYTRNADVTFGGAGASSTARDLTHWLIMYLNKGMYKGKQIIDEKDLLEAHTPQVLILNSDKKTDFYALGMEVNYDNKESNIKWQHNGIFTTGVRSILFMLPEAKLGLVVLVNAIPSGLPEGLAQALEILYTTGDKSQALSVSYNSSKDKKPGLAVAYNIEEDKEKALLSYNEISHYMAKRIENVKIENAEKTPLENPKPALPIERYIGTYTNDYFDLLEVKQIEDGIEAYLGNHRVKMTLKHYDGNKFIYKYTDISKLQDNGFLNFILDDKGNVVEAKIEGVENGDFTRKQIDLSQKG